MRLTHQTIFMSHPVWPAGHYISRLSVRPSVRPSHFRGTTLRAAPSKSYAFSTNYHACIAMPTWPRCAPPILCWPWPTYNLFPRSCLTCIFFIDSHWWVPLCVQRPQSYAILTNYCIPRTKYVRGILWFSRRSAASASAAASADTSSFSR